METLFVSRDCVLERDGGTLMVRPKNDAPRRFPVHALRHVVVAGEARLTTAVLTLLARSDIRLTVLDHYGNAAGTFESVSSPASGTVRLAQARHVLDPALRLDLARRIVRGTMRNLRANLSYRAYRGNAALRAPAAAIAGLEARLGEAEGIEALMGLEGNARAWYYGAWPLIDPRLALGRGCAVHQTIQSTACCPGSTASATPPCGTPSRKRIWMAAWPFYIAQRRTAFPGAGPGRAVQARLDRYPDLRGHRAWPTFMTLVPPGRWRVPAERGWSPAHLADVGDQG